MSESISVVSVDELYADIGLSDDQYEAIVDRSLQPRDRDMLYDKLGTFGLNEQQRVLDIGCYDAHHSLEIGRRFHCRVVAMDVIAANLEKAQQNVAASDLIELVTVQEGRIEAIPLPDKSLDFIWCRDMLNHITDLEMAFSECVRVLAPNGKMLLHNTFATELLEPQEAQRVFLPLAVVPQTTDETLVSHYWQKAGLRVLDREAIGGEWREKWEEDGTRYTSHQLLRVSRLLRDKERLVKELGPKVYASELADCTWGVYHLLGKLTPIVFVLTKEQW